MPRLAVGAHVSHSDVTNRTPAIVFSHDGPFSVRVAAFMLATTGSGPLYQSDNLLRLSTRDSIS
jgi:hypothetical protein